MADIYVRSTDGSDADSGSTWALAKATLAGAAAIDVAGDTIFLSQAHAETQSASMTISLAGTASNPVRVICANDAAAPPTSSANTATVSTTQNTDMVITGSAVFHGITFSAGTNTSTIFFVINSTTGHIQRYKSCRLRTLNLSGGTRIYSGVESAGAPPNETILENTILEFAAPTQRYMLSGCNWTWRGGSLAGSALTGPVFELNGGSRRGAQVLLDGVDLSAAASTVTFCLLGGAGARFVMRNCKLPSSWTGSLISGAPQVAGRAEMYNCDNGDTNYRIVVEDFAGSIRDETIIVRAGGASDGTTALSWRMSSNSNANIVAQLASPEIVVWNESIGSALTVTVEVVTDGVTLTDAQAWLEVQYLGTSGQPLSLFATDDTAGSNGGNVLATATNQTASVDTWTTTGLTTPVKQKLAVTFTPQEKGFIHAVVKLARASTTVYVDPLLTVT